MEVLLLHIGINAESLAAANVVTESEIDDVVGSVVDAVVKSSQSIFVLDQLQTNQNASFQQLGQRIRSGQASTDERASFERIQKDRSRIERKNKRYFESLTFAMESALNESQVLILKNLQSSLQWNVPVYYRVVERTESDWIRLRNACQQEERAMRIGEIVDTETSLVLSAARMNQQVRKARERIDKQKSVGQITESLENSMAKWAASDE